MLLPLTSPDPMDNLNEPFEDLVANRLLAKVGEELNKEENQVKEHTQQPEVRKEATLSTRDFTKIEKNLASLGFFTPSSKRIKNEKVKNITFVKVIEGKRIEARATIAPTAIYGLSITADQDKYLALQKLIGDIHQREGSVKNPVGFSSAELLRLLNKHRDSGKNYKEIEEWLNVMASTTIISEGVVYFAGKKTWAKDRFHVFDRAVSFGKEIEPGNIADKNYVWLSEWQLENINNNYLLPIELETYRQLKNHIAKALVPLLQIWLYATRQEGAFEKRYDEICQFLGIRQYRHRSLITQTLGPSLDELKTFDYLADWKIDKTSDLKGYKIIFYHGEKFHRDRKRRQGQKEQITTGPEKLAEPAPGETVVPIEQGIDPLLLGELTKRGIPDKNARKLVENAAADQQIIDQLEYGDFLINQAEPGKFHNPTGFYIYLVKEHIVPPDTFESTRQRRLREQAKQHDRREDGERLRLELAYNDYKRGEIDRYIASNYAADQFQQLVDRKKEELMNRRRSLYQAWPEETLIALAEREVRVDLAQWVPFTNFETFCEQNRNEPEQLTLSDAGQESPPPFAV